MRRRDHLRIVGGTDAPSRPTVAAPKDLETTRKRTMDVGVSAINAGMAIERIARTSSVAAGEMARVNGLILKAGNALIEAHIIVESWRMSARVETTD